MKMISDTTYAVVLFMTGVTILVAPFLLRIVFHKERSAMLQGETESAEVALQQEQT